MDEAIGEITSSLPEDTALMMLSDHGMTSSGTAYNLNTLLKEEGYLTVEDKPDSNYNAVRANAANTAPFKYLGYWSLNWSLAVNAATAKGRETIMVAFGPQS